MKNHFQLEETNLYSKEPEATATTLLLHVIAFI